MSLSERISCAGWFQRIFVRLFAPTRASSLAVFRMAFGGILIWEVWRYFSNGWIESYFTGKVMYFTYPGFSWVAPWPTLPLMELHFVLLGIFAAMVVAGLCYRFAAVGLFLTFTYVFLLEEARYLNHFYLVMLVAFLMILVPANRMWSVDAWIGSRAWGVGRWGLAGTVYGMLSNFSPYPLHPTPYTPTWSLWLLRFQIGVVYFYGGIAKLTPDWLRGYPLTDWISDEGSFPVIGSFMDDPWMGLALSYGGLLVDLLIVPLLLWRRTRWLGFFVAVAFNLMNAKLFSIGIFPWLMLAGTLLFFAPDWPEKLLRRFARATAPIQRKEASLPALTKKKKALAVFLAVYVAVQLLFPLRHWLYPGVVHWTEEGHVFSWHMKLRSKSADVMFLLKDPASERTWKIDPDDYLDSRQADKMSARPDMILQFAHWLRDNYRAQGFTRIEVYADSWARLNGREEQRMVDPSVNLAEIEWSLLPADWILPLTTPLEE